MSTLLTSSAYDIKIASVEITAERLPRAFEIVRNVTEINIYEHIDLPYLTGSIMISDSNDIFSRIRFLGTEKVLIRCKINGDDRSRIVEKRFIVSEISNVSPVNDNAEGILLNIIEEHAFLSRLNVLSKAYSGKPENIISQIIFDGTKRRVDVPKEFQTSSNPPMKVVLPSMSPIQAARWIKNRMTTPEGSPYFLYSTLNGPNLFLKSLSTMLADNPMNLSRPYTYGQAFARSIVGEPIDEQARTIDSYAQSRTESMFRLAEKNVLNSEYKFIDTVREQDPLSEKTRVNMQDVVSRLVQTNTISREQSKAIYDDKFRLEDKGFSDYTPSRVARISTSNTFESFANYQEAESIDQHRVRAYSQALRWYLLKAPIDITMPGFDFLGRGADITIGKQIRLQFMKNDPAVTEDNESAIDKKRSGDYIVYTMRHIMRPEKYAVAASCAKLGERDG